ncbi:DUF4870 domain-containing protein [Candidatus Villigracilis saccharophilus]|uniref:DUF4870 domain-containing protein n=1 Tax=Candidatus Villigracilis saccharophilus TaxID=3140684 RepID=UPI003135E094|nr:DUF4870 domain-containing protein [Anaerolineales bacterium]
MEKPTSDEKVLAALAHASVLFAFFGPVGPTLIWAFQRNKSKYVRFHALQAMGYQALTFWAWFIGIFFAVFGGIVISIVIAAISNIETTDMSVFPFIVQPIIMLSIFGLFGLFFLVGIIGAVFCMLDRDFNYPIIGRWLKGKLFGEQIREEETEEWEDNWVSGICHSTAILQLWGIVTPLIVWFTQKERSAKLRFQALQAAIYQLIAFAAYIIGTVAYMAFIFIMIFGLMIFSGSPTSPNSELSPAAGIISMLFFAILMIFWLIIMIAMPIYYLLAGAASILTIRGKNFKYPIIGGIISSRITPQKVEEIIQS